MEASSPCCGVSPVESTRLESNDKRILKCVDQSQRTSSVVDHMNSNQHKAAMAYLKVDLAKANNKSVTSFSLIGHSLMNMDASTRERMKHKFDICYVMAKEGIAFSKYPVSRHDIDLGVAYKNDVSAKSFTHFSAQSQRDRYRFVHFLSNSHYFSFLMDGTTDLGKVEDELVVVLYCKQDDVVKEIRACARYLSVVTHKADTDGLVDSLKEALKTLKIDDVLALGSLTNQGVTNLVLQRPPSLTRSLKKCVWHWMTGTTGLEL